MIGMLGLIFAAGAFVAMPILAWVTHIAWAIKLLASPSGITMGQAVLALIGALLPPIGMLHGVLIWLGAA
jgi:hypothetical protein